MKVICERSALLAAVNNVASVVPTRTPSPALSCLKLVATKTAGVSELQLFGTDAETSLSLSITQVDVAQPGVAVVSAEKLRQIVQAVESEQTLTIELADDVCHIRGSAARFRIFAYAADQYPQVPDMAQATSNARSVFTHSAAGMLALINKTVFATARETSRYAINGVLLKRDGKKVEMVATDGRRLALCRSTLKAADAKDGAAASCIIPTKGLNLFTKLAGNPEENVRIAITDNRIFFAFEDVIDEDKKKPSGRPPRAVLTSALVEGTFPPYEDVIPKDNDKKGTIDRDALAAGVREAKILTNEESRGVRMNFSAKNKRLKLTSRAPEMGESEVDVDLSSYEGEDVEISFNPDFIADALKTMEESEVVIELKSTTKPGLIRSGAEFVYVIMPVNLAT